MTPVSPVMPGSQPIETVFGKDQPEYIPLPAVYLDTPSRTVVTRWRLTEEERHLIANGGDVVLQQLTFRNEKTGLPNPLQPVHLQVAMPDAMPTLVE